MYVCICHAVTEEDVRGCMAGGACTSAREVKAACGMKPGCGSCTRRLYGLISEYQDGADTASAGFGAPLTVLAEAGREPATAA